MNEHAAPQRVFRSRSDRVVAGVAGGFARYLGLDVAIVRLVLVVLAFVGGLGVLLYLAAWLVVPEEPVQTGGDAVPGAAGPRPHVRGWWLVLLAVVAVALPAELGHVGFGLRPGIVWPLALIGFGVALLWLRAGDGPAVAGTGAPGAGTGVPAAGTRAATGSTMSTTAPVTTTGAPGATGPTSVDATAPSAPWAVAGVTPSPLRRAAPVLGRIVLVLAAAVLALVVTAGAVLMFEGLGWLRVTPVDAIVTSVLVVLAAVAIGLGRHRLPDLVVIAVPVVVVLAVAGWLGPPMRGGYGTRDVRPADVHELDRTYRLAAGTLDLDLSAVDLAGRSRTVDASVAMGRLDVVVPDQVTVVLDAHADAGETIAFGVRDTGVGVSRHTTARGSGGTLHLRTDVGFGQVTVERATVAADATRRTGAEVGA